MIQRAGRTARLGVAGAVAVLLACLSPSLEPRSPEARVRAGADWFEGRCAPCHGSSADGRGLIAPHLSTPPADLTRIASRNGGRFDARRVEAFIDGTDRVGAHGSAEMPVWESFAAERRNDVTHLDPRAVALIVEFLASVQER